MSILSGFRKQKRYATDEKGRHQLISTWTHTDTVYDDEGKSLTEIIEDLPAADKKVQQTATDSTNANYEILFSESADNVTKSEEARKSSRLLYNPGTKKLSLAGSKLEVTGSNNGTTEVGGGSMTISRNNNLMEPQLSIYNEHSGGEALLRSNNIQIRDDYTSPTKVMEIQQEDIVLTGDTWDGTNTSLKTALANAGAKVLYGTSAPTSSQGEDGQLYVQLKTLSPYLDNFVVDYSASTQGGIDTELDISNLNECVIYIDQYQMVADAETLVGQYEEEVDFQNFNFLEITDDLGDVVLELGTSTGSDDLFVRKRNASDKFILSVVDANATADAIDKIYIKDNGEWLADNDSTIPSPTSEDTDKILGATDIGEYGWVNNIRFFDSGATAEVYTNHISVNQTGYGGSSMTRDQIQISNIMGSSIKMTSSDVTLGGTWDGTNTSLKAAIAAAGGGTDEHAVHVPSVIFDNGELKKINDMSGFPGIEKVFLTAEEYAQLTTAEKEDLTKIYYITQYKFYSFEDGKIIIRTNANANETKWYFNGFEVPNNGTYTVPSEMSSYFNPNQSSYAYSDETSETNLGYIEFSSNVIYFQQGFWSGSWIATGTPVWGVVSKNGGNQQNTYSDPYDTETPILVYYGNKQYTDFDIPDPLPEVSSSDNGKVLKVVEGEWAAGADEGGSEAVYKTLAEYEALTTAQKEDPTKIYFVINEGTKVSPTLAADDGNCNATNAPTYAWWCLSGDASTEFQISDGGLSEYNSPAWWSYHFSTRKIFSKVKMRYRNNSSENRVRFSIQASNDGSTWTEILVGNPKYVDLTTENVDMEFIVDTGNVAYEYIRLRFDMPSGWAAGAIKICGNLEIYATANSSSPMVYYKNILYTPNELPITSTSDAGKILAVNADGLWDKATNNGIIPIRLSKTAYDALTPAQKADESKLYLIDGSIITDETLISPDDLVADDGNVISSGGSMYGDTNRQPWTCFDAYDITSGSYNNYWTPAQNGTPVIGYHFTDKPHKITKVKIRLISNQGDTTNSVYVEGSNDGTNWIDISKNGGTTAVAVTEAEGYHDHEIETSFDTAYSYVRIRFASAVNVSYSGKFVGLDAVKIYATETAKVYNAICYNGSEYASLDPQHYFKEISQTDYDALPDTKNSDGIIYFITDYS